MCPTESYAGMGIASILVAQCRSWVKSGVLSESRMSAFDGSGHAVGKAMCEKRQRTKSLRDSQRPSGQHYPQGEIVPTSGANCYHLRGESRQTRLNVLGASQSNRRHPPVIALTLKPSRRPPRHNQRRLRVRPTFQRE